MKKKRPSEWEQLIKDYHKQHAYIEWQKRKWLTPPDERKENGKITIKKRNG